MKFHTKNILGSVIIALFFTIDTSCATESDSGLENFLFAKRDILTPVCTPTIKLYRTPTELVEQINHRNWNRFYSQHKDPRHPEWEKFSEGQKFTRLGNPIDPVNHYLPLHEEYLNNRLKFAEEMYKLPIMKKFTKSLQAVRDCYEEGGYSDYANWHYNEVNLKDAITLVRRLEEIGINERRDLWISYYKKHPDPLHPEWNFDSREFLDSLQDFTTEGWPILM